MSARATRDSGRFTIVPEWVVRRGFSPRALSLYIELGFHADYDTGECFPSHATLAAAMSCSTDTVQRAQAELERGDAIIVERRTDPAGDRTSNLYTVLTVDPRPPVEAPTPIARGSRKSAATQPHHGARGSRTDAAVTNSPNEPSPAAAIARGEQALAAAREADATEPSPHTLDHIAAIRRRRTQGAA